MRSRTHSLAISLSIACSSLSTAKTRILLCFYWRGSSLVRQSEHALGDDIGLDLVAAAIDREGLAMQPGPGRAALLLAIGIAAPAEAVRSHQLDDQFGAFLHDVRPEILDGGDGGIGAVARLGFAREALER